MAKYMDSGGLSHFMSKLKGITGEPEAPYTEVEWVESNGKQYVYLDWKPPIATWGFEADFIIRNAFSTTVGAWNASTNVNGYGNLFGTRNASTVNDCQLGSYGTTGLLRFGSASYATAGLFKTDKTRQQVSLLGTSLKRGDGTTVTVARSSETSGKYYANMTVFAMHEGARRSTTGNLVQPGTCRVYALKFYESTTVKVDLVGAVRKSDGCTGLYDKVAGHFYPAPGMTYGSEVGDLGDSVDLTRGVENTIPFVYADNPNPTRMWRVSAPTLDRLRDGQQINLTFLYNIGASVQTTELAGWDDTSNNTSVYLKITLADGTVTDWIPCFCLGTTRLTSHYLGGSTLRLTYRENVTPNSSQTSTASIMRGWFCDPFYNTDQQFDRFTDTCIAGKNGIKRYTLCMKDDEGNWTSITTTANSAAATGKAAYTGGLQLGKVLYALTGAEYAAGANSGVLAQTYQSADFRYSVNGITNAAATTELQLRKPVYLVGTLGSDGLFYLDTTKWWTQSLPTTEDGKVYVHVGTAYSSYYAIFLAAVNLTYKYQDGRIVEVFAGDATTVGGHTVNSDVPANAVFTDTKYTDDDAVSAVENYMADIPATWFYDTYESKLAGISAGAEVNQNAFSNVKVGTTTVAADSKTDTLELAAGTRITLTPDATNDKVTIATSASTVGYSRTVTSGTKIGTITINGTATDIYAPAGSYDIDADMADRYLDPGPLYFGEDEKVHVDGPLPVEMGGTGGYSPSTALQNLGIGQACDVNWSGSQAISSTSTDTQIKFTALSHNTSTDFFTVSGNSVKILKAGNYLIQAGISLNPATNGDLMGITVKNSSGNAVIGPHYMRVGGNYEEVNTPLRLITGVTANTTWTLWARNNTSGRGTVTVARLMIVKIS